MPLLVLSLAAVFGLIIGSFLGVVVDRYNTGRSLGGRSFCFSCSRHLSWHELVPVMSFLWQKGRCLGCRSRLSFRYAAIEILTGAVFALIAYKYAFLLFFDPLLFASAFALFAVIWSILIVILFYDLRHMIIPDPLVLAFSVLALLSQFAVFGPVLAFSVPPLATLLYPFLLALPFAALWLVSRGRWIGLGDAKLIVGMGFLLGLSGGIAAVLLGFWSGAVAGVCLLLLRKWRFTMKTEIPFAPFLILGTLLAFFFNLDFWSIASFFVFSL